MFNNIIYFIIVLLIFNLGLSDREQTTSLLYSLSMMTLFWLIFAVYCRRGFKKIIALYQGGLNSGNASIYNRLILRLSVIAIFIFSLDVFAFNLNYWIENIPVVGGIYILQGLSAIFLFVIYLSTVWYFAHPAYNLVFNADIPKKTFILWNVRLNIPVIFPWLFLSLVIDLLSMSRWQKLNLFLDKPEGQILFFVIFLFIAMVFLPVLVQYFWGCEPLDNSPKAESIRNFLRDMDFRYRELVSWPILGGKMMTAGIMGIIPRFRYILITDSLMEVLTPSELNAVMAHEAGHARYKHQMLLAFFFLGYFILLLGFSDPVLMSAVLSYLVSKMPGDNISTDAYFLFISVPMLIALIVYFRFIMGFFMRNFERQADTYAALTVGDPSPIISSLEKIALLSGKIRDVPSWHHFSIKQRVDFLAKSHNDPGEIVKHRKLMLSSFIIYLGVILSLSYILYFSPVKKHFSYKLLSRVLIEEVENNPENTDLRLSLAGLYYELDRPVKAAEIYEEILSLDRKNPGALNDFAWLLLTTDNQDIKDINRGFEYAKESVELERLPESLDTLAEGYWANGNNEMAVQIEKEAIMRDKTNNPHYRRQLEKFIAERRF